MLPNGDRTKLHQVLIEGRTRFCGAPDRHATDVAIRHLLGSLALVRICETPKSDLVEPTLLSLNHSNPGRYRVIDGGSPHTMEPALCRIHPPPNTRSSSYRTNA